MICPVEFREGDWVVRCDRGWGHMPSGGHRNRVEGIVWYIDRREAA